MEIFRDRDALKLASEALENLFREAGDAPVLFLSSGGSALRILDNVDINVFTKNFTIGVLDERFSFDPAINNFLQLKKKLNDVTGVRWIDFVPKKGETPESFVSRMNGAWKMWRRENPTGKIIVTLGMGTDGHTVGITVKLCNMGRLHNRWAVGYVSDLPVCPWRVTATFEFLRSQVDNAIIYISGEEKRPALEKVLADFGSLSETPAKIFREIKNARIFTDILE